LSQPSQPGALAKSRGARAPQKFVVRNYGEGRGERGRTVSARVELLPYRTRAPRAQVRCRPPPQRSYRPPRADDGNAHADDEGWLQARQLQRSGAAVGVGFACRCPAGRGRGRPPPLQGGQGLALRPHAPSGEAGASWQGPSPPHAHCSTPRALHSPALSPASLNLVRSRPAVGDQGSSQRPLTHSSRVLCSLVQLTPLPWAAEGRLSHRVPHECPHTASR